MSSNNKIKTMVVVGSTRDGRMGDRVGKFIAAQINKETHDVDYVDIADLNLSFMEQALGYMDPSAIPPQLQDLASRVKAADCYIFISPEYNHSISPALTNFVNHFPLTSFAYKPSGIATYSMGPYGGVRAAMQMRALTGELGCTAVSPMFAAPVVQSSLDAEGTALGENGERLVAQATKLLAHLDWMTQATKSQREKRGIPN